MWSPRSDDFQACNGFIGIKRRVRTLVDDANERPRTLGGFHDGEHWTAAQASEVIVLGRNASTEM